MGDDEAIIPLKLEMDLEEKFFKGELTPEDVLSYAEEVCKRFFRFCEKRGLNPRISWEQCLKIVLESQREALTTKTWIFLPAERRAWKIPFMISKDEK